jgi:hypothetical protein
MATVIGQSAQYPLRASRKEKVMMTARVVIGAAGAVGTTSEYDDPGLSVVLNGAGTYDVTMPKCPGQVRVKLQVYSPLLTVVNAVVTAKDFAAGTMTFKTIAATSSSDTTPVATNPASGDEVWLQLCADLRAGN